MATPPTVINGAPGEDVGKSNAFLGDIDGDGLDDFFVLSTPTEPTQPQTSGMPDAAFEYVGKLYLFYGRATFPTRMSTRDADAVFDAPSSTVGSLGDVNGDGLADFAIPRASSTEIVFGRRQRWRGAVASGAAGITWTVPASVRSHFPPGFLTELTLARAGDFNGDGLDDLLVQSLRMFQPAELSESGTLASSWYLLLSGPELWKPDAWDPSRAAARFAVEYVPPEELVAGMTSYFPLQPVPVGDLDADGRADLVAMSAARQYVFYGGRELPEIVGGAEADATLHHDPYAQVLPIDDADGDGASELILQDRSVGLGIAYGRRWSGTVMLEPDFKIRVIGIANGGWAAAGDMNGDGFSELVVPAARSGEVVSPGVSRPPTGAVYVLRGAGTRALGAYEVKESDVLLRGPRPGTSMSRSIDSGLGWTLSFGGDADGDGGCDVLTSSLGNLTSQESFGAVFLLPSGMLR